MCRDSLAVLDEYHLRHAGQRLPHVPVLPAGRYEDAVSRIELEAPAFECYLESALEHIPDVPFFTPVGLEIPRVLDETKPPRAVCHSLESHASCRRLPREIVEFDQIIHRCTPYRDYCSESASLAPKLYAVSRAASIENNVKPT